jgi:hypothetical protein
MRVITCTLTAAIAISGWSAVSGNTGAPGDREILGQVADEYGLQGNARKLLLVIRRVENGGDGIEMGVMLPQARRYKGDHVASLRLQARYAAGTIRRRYNGDLAAFAASWAPIGAQNDPRGLNRNWLRNARQLMEGGDL